MTEKQINEIKNHPLMQDVIAKQKEINAYKKQLEDVKALKTKIVGMEKLLKS